MLDPAMEPRAKLWLEQDGKLVLSEYRVRLLKLIDETGALSVAAERMGLSYRRAWGKLREIEDNLGMQLVERAVGGVGGGGSRLTAEGRTIVERFERFRQAAERDVAQEFSRAFKRSP
jgi:molybdate transport system regulatory protein